MKIHSILGAAFLASGMAAVMPAQAADPACADLKFTADVVAQFPNANEFCNEVAVRDGKEYALFKGEVRRVKGGTVYMRFKRPEGTYGETVSFTPPASFRVKIDGRSYTIRNLNPGQELSVWVPEDAWVLAQEESAADLVGAATVSTVAIEKGDDEGYVAAATLPRTASYWPLVAALGSGLVGLGFLIGWYRRRTTG